MKCHLLPFAFAAVIILGLAPGAQAQPEHRWSVEVATGWDNSISGNINSGAVGQLNGQTVVVLKNTYDEVYGTGLHFRFGGGYILDEVTEARLTFTLQSLDADLVSLGDIGTSRLYAQYDDYQSFGLDVLLRRYAELGPAIQGYVEGSLGLASSARPTWCSWRPARTSPPTPRTPTTGRPRSPWAPTPGSSGR